MGEEEEVSVAAQIIELSEPALCMEKFANLLFHGSPEVFGNVHRVRRFLDLADRRFRGGDERVDSFFTRCSHSLQHGGCWALTFRERFNVVLNPRGMELVAASECSLAFQTMENAYDILFGPGDLFSMCICLWVLREHRCISRVMVDVGVVASYHSAVFWRLLSFLNRGVHLDSVLFRGLPGVDIHFKIFPLFRDATRLTKLELAYLHLDLDQVGQLCDLISQNAGLISLVLKGVGLDPEGVRRLGFVTTEHGRPKELEIEENATEIRGFEDAAADLLDTELEKIVLDLPCRLSCLFDSLGNNRSLTELDIVDTTPRPDLSLYVLSDSLTTNTTLKRLTLRLYVPDRNLDIMGGWKRLARSIAYNRTLEYLSFSLSQFGVSESEAMAALGDAIAINGALEELCFERCQLSCASIFALLSGLARNQTRLELKLGDLGDEGETSSQLLQQVADLGLGERVKCVYTLWHGGQLQQALKYNYLMAIHGLRLVSGLANDRDAEMVCLVLMSSCLNTLCIEGAPMTECGSRCLSKVLRVNKALRNVTLIFPATAAQVAVILEGSASSRVTSLIVGGGWQLSRVAVEAFEGLLRKNNSIVSMTVMQVTAAGFEDLKRHLNLGLADNSTITRLRLMHGHEPRESRDSELLQSLHKNREKLIFKMDATFGRKMTAASAFSSGDCDECQAFPREETEANKEAVQKKTIEALETMSAQLERVALSNSLNRTKTGAETAPSAEPSAARGANTRSAGATKTAKGKEHQPRAAFPKPRRTKRR